MLASMQTTLASMQTTINRLEEGGCLWPPNHWQRISRYIVYVPIIVCHTRLGSRSSSNSSRRRQEVAASYAVEVVEKVREKKTTAHVRIRPIFVSSPWGEEFLDVYITDSKHETCGPAARSVPAYNGSCMQTYHSRKKRIKAGD